MVLPQDDLHGGSICKDDGLKYLYTQPVTVHETSIPVSMSLMKSPKVGRLCAVVRASVMFCFACRGIEGLSECELCSADDILLSEPAVCVSQVLVFLRDRGFRILYLSSACLSVSKAYLLWCHCLSPLH